MVQHGSDLRLAPGGTVTVRLVKDPRPEVRYPAEVVADDGNHLVVRAPWAGPPVRDMGFVRFVDGDVWTEHYWRDRWYAIKEVRDSSGTLKGWYCDVNRPATVRDGVLVVEDLDLDLWLSADGRTMLRLDEDEFLDSGLTERDPDAAAAARRALDELAVLAGDSFDSLLSGPATGPLN
jgi:predicted RNA-binding protein associated with RNAse of E/G family